MKLGFTRRLPIVASGIAIAAMVGLTAGCGGEKKAHLLRSTRNQLSVFVVDKDSSVWSVE